MRNIKAIAAAFLVCASSLWHSSANAVSLVNTGAPTDEMGWGFDTGIAGVFSTDRPWLVTDIQAYLAVVSEGAATFTAAIYQDAGGLPGTALYTASFVVDNVEPFELQGATDLSWRIEPGSYWVAFITAPDAPPVYAGAVPPQPLAAYAQSFDGGDTWVPNVGGTLALTVEATPVPLPAGAWLLGAALACLGSLRRERR